MDHGVWIMGYGSLDMGHEGVWAMGHGAWVMGYGSWGMGHAVCLMEYGTGGMQVTWEHLRRETSPACTAWSRIVARAFGMRRGTSAERRPNGRKTAPAS